MVLAMRSMTGGCLLGCVAGRLDDQHRRGVALDEGHARREARVQAALPDDGVVHLLDGGGAGVEQRDRGLKGLQDGVEVNDGEGRRLGTGGHSHLGAGEGDQRALGADDDLGHVHGVSQDLVQVVAADAPLDLGVAAVDLVGLLLCDAPGLAVDVALEGLQGELGLELLRRQLLEGGYGAVGQHDLELQHVVERLAVHDGAGAAGVVADGPADVAPVGGRRVRRELEAVGRAEGAELVEHDARLDPRPTLLRVHLDELVHVSGEVHDDGMVHGLPGQTGATASGQHGHALRAGEGDGVDHVLDVHWEDDADGVHLVDGGVGGVDGAGHAVEAHLTAQPPAQLRLKLGVLPD